MKVNNLEKYPEFKNRTCLIAGGNGLLGSKLSEALLMLGAKVIILDINIKKTFSSGNYQEIKVDFRNDSEIDLIVKKILTKNKINHLFNCLNGKPNDLSKYYESIDKYDPVIWREVCKVNIDATFRLTALVGSQMVQNNFGTIVNFASIYGSTMGSDQRIYENLSEQNKFNTPAVYATTKGAIVALTKHLSALWGEFNVRTNVLSPGGVYNQHTSDFNIAYSNRIPLRRMANIEEIIWPAIFLASNDAQYINGHELFVDGGLHAW